jgi:hypothetical protein
MMTKGDTISEIMRLNPSVGATFLSEFNNDQLARYLRRLRDLRESSHRRSQTLSLHNSALTRPEALQSA